MGVDTFKAEVERRSGVVFEPIRPYEFTERGDKIGWLKGIDNRWHLTLFIENGRLIDLENKPLKPAWLKLHVFTKGTFV